MADSFVRLPVDGVGKLLDTSQLTVNAQTVQRERMIIGDNTANNYVTVSASGGALVDQGAATALSTAWPVELSDGTNLIGVSAHPIRTDPTGTTIQPVSWSAQTVTVTQGTGTNLHTVIDSGTITTVSSVTAIANALPSGTNVIGHVIVDSGTITAVTSITNQVDTNIKQVAGTTATQGDVNNATSAAGSLDIAPIARYNATQPTLTDTRYNMLQVSVRGELLVTPGTTGFPVTFGSAQHVIVDSGTITTVSTVTAVTAITNALPAGSNVIGHVITDATSVTNATLSAETTKVIGVVRTADGSGNLLTTNSTTYTAKNALDSNLLGTLGTAFTTAGFIDIKGADGNVFVRNATAGNFLATVSQGATDWKDNIDQVAGSAVSTAASGTILVGLADGAGTKLTSNSIATSGKVGLDTNVLSILGTAPTTAGFLDIKGADGNVFVRQTTAANLNATVVGTLTNNNAVPAGTNFGVLPAIASTAAQSYTSGDQVLLNTDLNGYLKVNISAGAGGGTAMVDQAAFTEGTTSFTPVGGFYDVDPGLLSEGTAGSVQITSDRRMLVTDIQEITTQDILYQLLLETRAVKATLVQMVTEAGTAAVDDFAPGNFQDMYVTQAAGLA